MIHLQPLDLPPLLMPSTPPLGLFPSTPRLALSHPLLFLLPWSSVLLPRRRNLPLLMLRLRIVPSSTTRIGWRLKWELTNLVCGPNIMMIQKAQIHSLSCGLSTPMVLLWILRRCYFYTLWASLRKIGKLTSVIIKTSLPLLP